MSRLVGSNIVCATVALIALCSTFSGDFAQAASKDESAKPQGGKPAAPAGKPAAAADKANEKKSDDGLKSASDPKKASADGKKLLKELTLFEDKASGISVSYPKSWNVEQPKNGLHIVRFKRPEPGASISFSAQDAFKNETLKDFVDTVNDKVIKDGAHNNWKVTVTSNKLSGELGGSPAVRTEFKYIMEPPMQSRVTTVTSIKGGKAYSLNYTSIASIHDAYLPVFNEMVKSAKISAAPTALKDTPRRTAIPAKLNQ